MKSINYAKQSSYPSINTQDGQTPSPGLLQEMSRQTTNQTNRFRYLSNVVRGEESTRLGLQDVTTQNGSAIRSTSSRPDIEQILSIIDSALSLVEDGEFDDDSSWEGQHQLAQ